MESGAKNLELPEVCNAGPPEVCNAGLPEVCNAGLPEVCNVGLPEVWNVGLLPEVWTAATSGLWRLLRRWHLR
jgi:hypothetical protein